MPDLAADVALLADADRREPLQHYGKDQQRVDGDDEVGNRDEADRQHRDQLVREAIAANGGEAAERDADEGGPADGAQHQGDRVGQLAQDDRSEERRVWKEWVSTCISRWSEDP